MGKPPPRFRLAEWLTALLLLPLLAGFAYLLTLGTLRLSLSASDAEQPTPAPFVQSEQAGLGWQKVENDAPAPAAVPFAAVNEWLARAAAPAVGLTRANPHPPHELVSLEHWQLRLLDRPAIRGDAAWQLLEEANSYNEPPAAGYEYILVPLWVRHQRLTSGNRSLSIHITGEQGIVYFSFATVTVPPEPMLETNLPGYGQSSGWEPFRIQEGEQKLQLVVVDSGNSDEPPHYVALDDDGGIVIIETALAALLPTNIGRHASEPARVGETATTDNWQITVSEIVSGEAAWAQILSANRFNEEALAGREYGMLRIRMRYIGLEEGPHRASRYLFQVLGDDGTAYDLPSLVYPEPELYFDLYPGGEVEGWLLVETAIADEAPLLVFRPHPFTTARESANTRYFLIGKQ